MGRRWNLRHNLFLSLVVGLEDQIGVSKEMKTWSVVRDLPWNIYFDSQEFWTSNWKMGTSMIWMSRELLDSVSMLQRKIVKRRSERMTEERQEEHTSGLYRT